MIKLYTIGCPACNIVERKLNDKKIQYETISDEQTLTEKNIEIFPQMQIDDGPLMGIAEIIRWINTQEG